MAEDQLTKEFQSKYFVLTSLSFSNEKWITNSTWMMVGTGSQ